MRILLALSQAIVLPVLIKAQSAYPVLLQTEDAGLSKAIFSSLKGMEDRDSIRAFIRSS